MGTHQQKQTGGFTLIELSIVLVIIGLIVGGILTGQELIRSATLKSVITDEQKYVTAVNTFRTKYNELPGDMVDATNIWGTDPNTCPDPGAYTTAQTTTCNGNGNGLIENSGTGGSGGLNQYETFRAWQQLANAGLIQGAYTGTPGAAIWFQNLVGINTPASKVTNAGFEWTAFNANARYSASNWNAQYNVQYLLFGTNSAIIPGLDANTDLIQPALTSSDAKNIDLKMDDGLPASGNILGMQNYTTCVTQPASIVIYNTSLGAPGCSLLFAVKSW